jgi:hypothetical protein
MSRFAVDDLAGAELGDTDEPASPDELPAMDNRTTRSSVNFNATRGMQRGPPSGRAAPVTGKRDAFPTSAERPAVKHAAAPPRERR